MDKLILTIEFEYDADLTHGNTKDGIEWFFEHILKQDGNQYDDLKLHSNEIGDCIGKVNVLQIHNCCPQCNSEAGLKFPRNNNIYCEDCGWPDSDFDEERKNESN